MRVALVGLRSRVNVFFGIRPSFWCWGVDVSWYDGPLVDIGLGPLFLVALDWEDSDRFLRFLEKHRLSWIVRDLDGRL